MRNIAVFTCNRADEGPMGPVRAALQARTDVCVYDASEPPTNADWFLVLGDRHELLPACHAALLHQVPIAHIHGGETTLGSFDDKVRNAVTQLASIHFTAAEPFTQKLVSMGVLRESIFTVGPPGLDDLQTDDLSEFGTGFLLVCLHPDTTRDADYNVDMATALCGALLRFRDKRIVIIRGNDDPAGKEIDIVMRELGSVHPGVAHIRTLDRRRYLTALKHAAVCIGNSSSFVIEAPALGTPTVLVGDRQKGRPLAMSITQAAVDAVDIAGQIEVCLAARLRPDLDHTPYGRGGASQKIAEILATWSL